MNVQTVIIICIAAIVIVAIRLFEVQFDLGQWTLKTYVTIIGISLLFIGGVVVLYLKRGVVAPSSQMMAENDTEV